MYARHTPATAVAHDSHGALRSVGHDGESESERTRDRGPATLVHPLLYITASHRKPSQAAKNKNSTSINTRHQLELAAYGNIGVRRKLNQTSTIDDDDDEHAVVVEHDETSTRVG